MNVNHFKKLLPIVNKTRVHVKIEEKCGLPLLLNKYRRRKMFFIGIIICIGIIYGASLFIWDIEIKGNMTITEETIRKYLENSNIYYGVLKSNIDCEEVEKSLREEYDEVIWTSVEKKGTRIVVYIQESLLPDKNKSEQSNTPASIFATKEGKVTDIITRKGTPLVGVGSLVSPGSVMVDGKIEIKGDDESVIATNLVRAEADIYIETQYEYSDKFALRHNEKNYTDNVKNKYYVKVFSKCFNFYFDKNSDENIEKVTKQSQLKLWGDFYLPIYMGKITEKEYENYSIIYDKETAKKIANEKLQQFCADLEIKGIQILEKNVKIIVSDEQCISSGFIKVIEKNGEIKDISWEEQ